MYLLRKFVCPDYLPPDLSRSVLVGRSPIARAGGD